MFTIEKVDTKPRSLLRCDTCDEPILDARLAVALVGYGVIAVHVHKGRCHRRAEEKFEKQCDGWMELTEHLAQLVHNTSVQNKNGTMAVISAQELAHLRDRVRRIERSHAFTYIREQRNIEEIGRLRDWIYRQGHDLAAFDKNAVRTKIYDTTVENAIETLRWLEKEEREDEDSIRTIDGP